MQVCGQLKDVVSVVGSLLLFGDYVYSPLSAFGIVFGFGGAAFYAIAKLTKDDKPGSQAEAHHQAKHNTHMQNGKENEP